MTGDRRRTTTSPAAFKATLERHEQSIRTARRAKAVPKPTVGVLQRQIDRVDEEFGDDAEFEVASDDAVDAASRLFREPTQDEAALLKKMKDWATRASSRNDAKVQVLIDWLKQHLRLKEGEAMPWDDEAARVTALPIADAGEAGDLWAAVRALPDEEQRVLHGLYRQGRTYQEVADDTGIPLGTLKRRLRSALDTLRERLGTPRSGVPPSADLSTGSRRR